MVEAVPLLDTDHIQGYVFKGRNRKNKVTMNAALLARLVGIFKKQHPLPKYGVLPTTRFSPVGSGCH